ncbi:GATOR complex protein MIOS-like [Paramacrobiotus metropolitanus]|uniref:GATOR complex protein MIOS-like n=1 Tax=Paramacrobiotus metropolitanus TaxID=2943436 RepID=UPI0024465718|nr:GATOR complex protein MIOS-like [Paramacrobiotus metropolitanus]
MGTTLDIRWSPYEENLFVKLAADIVTLYQVENYPDGPLTAQSVMLSNRTHACPVVSSNASVCVRCLDWCPTFEFGRLLSAGTANGKVVIVGFQQDSSGRDSFRTLQNKEFAPRYLRPCNCVAWNATDPNLIAAGLDRYKNDHSLFVYDIFTSVTSLGGSGSRDDSRVDNETKAVVEFGAGEHVASCSWFHNKTKTLLTGFLGKGLKVYDIRESSKQPRGNTAKQVYGACSDPFGEYRLASFQDNQIAIWDLRNFDKFVVCQDVHKPVAQIAWSPTRYGLLGFTLRDTPDFRLFDVQYSHSHTQEDYEPFLLERTVSVTEGKSIAAFSWHPKQENRTLLLSSNNQMYDLQILERMTLNWSKNHHLLWACGRDIKYLTDQDAPEPIMRAVNEDISVRMKLRAVNSYGMKTENFLDNIPLVSGDKEPEAMWKWLELIRAIERFDLVEGISFRGIRSILFGKPIKSESTRAETVGWVSPQPQGRGGGITTFVNDERHKILRLCGWGTSRESTIEYLLSQEQFERAAAICVFHMNLEKAIEILQEAGKKSKDDKLYSIIAVALAGFTSEESIWHASCLNVGADIGLPYIRNIFLFLSSSRDATFRKIAEDDKMELEDRLAFACMFFPDQKLAEFIKDLTEKFTSRGILEGLCLTGFGSEGVDLVQSYVDRTSDVQTASLLMAIVTTREWQEDQRCHQWIENYREVLDSWMFWDARATFDVYNSRIKGGGPRIPRQISATCTFCGKAVSHTTGNQSFSARGEKLLNFPRTPNVSEIPKVMTCTSCGKTLPRCALCQINMGTPTNMGFVTGEFDDESVKKAQKINPLDKWFTWCQSCRHGGHASHLAEWFKDHVECAVTGCGCKCMVIENGCATVSNNRRRIATSN